MGKRVGLIFQKFNFCLNFTCLIQLLPSHQVSTHQLTKFVEVEFDFSELRVLLRLAEQEI